MSEKILAFFFLLYPPAFRQRFFRKGHTEIEHGHAPVARVTDIEQLAQSATDLPRKIKRER